MPIEDIDIFSTSLPTTLMHMLVSSEEKSNDSSHYYSCPVFCSVAKSNATVGYQFIALAPGKLFGKQRDFSLCAIAQALEVDTARHAGLQKYI